jgi:hypothetical protein
VPWCAGSGGERHLAQPGFLAASPAFAHAITVMSVAPSASDLLKGMQGAPNAEQGVGQVAQKIDAKAGAHQ